MVSSVDRALKRLVIEAETRLLGALSAEDFDQLLLDLSEGAFNESDHVHVRGFADSFRDIPEDVRRRTLSENPHYRTDYLLGVLEGLHRRRLSAAIVELLDRYPDDFAPLFTGDHGRIGASPVILAHALIEEGRAEDLSRIQPRAINALDERSKEEFVRTIVDECRDALQRSEIEAASDVVAAVTPIEVHESLSSDDQLLIKRRIAHVKRRQFEFEEAQEILEGLIQSQPDAVTLRKLENDLGLVKCELSSIRELHFPSFADAQQIIDDLSAGAAHFENGSSLSERTHGKGEYCLGLLSLARAIVESSAALFPVAADYFDKAISEFFRKERIYRDLGVMHEAQLNLAYCVAEGDLGDRAHRALEAVMYVVKLTGDPLSAVPQEQLQRTIRWLAREMPEQVDRLFSGQPHANGGQQLEELIVEVSNAERIETTGANLRKIRRARTAVEAQRARSPESAVASFLSYYELLESVTRQGDIDEARALLDDMERWVLKDPSMAMLHSYLSFVTDPVAYVPAWTRVDAVWSAARACSASNENFSSELGELLNELVRRLPDGDPTAWRAELIAVDLIAKRELGVSLDLSKFHCDELAIAHEYRGVRARSVIMIPDTNLGRPDDDPIPAIRACLPANHEIEVRRFSERRWALTPEERTTLERELASDRRVLLVSRELPTGLTAQIREIVSRLENCVMFSLPFGEVSSEEVAALIREGLCVPTP